MNLGYMRMILKLNNNQRFGSKRSRTQQKSFVQKALYMKQKWSLVLFGINGCVATVLLEDRKTANFECHTTISLPEVFEETDTAESFFIMTMLAATHRLKL